MSAFLLGDNTDTYKLRWFNPSREETFCGHATLASAHVLIPAGEERDITFHTRAGGLRARRAGTGMVELDFPAGDARLATETELTKVQTTIGEALGGQAKVVTAHIGSLDVYVELEMAPGVHLKDVKIAQAPFVYSLPLPFSYLI